MLRRCALLVLFASIVLADDAALKLERSRIRLEVELATTWRSSDHKLRSLDDSARLEATLDATPCEGGVEAKATDLALTRRKCLRVSGVLSDDDKEAKGEARWKAGDANPPPAWRMLVSDRGVATADVNSAAPVWHLEAWLQGFDHSNDEDARLRRLIHYLDLGFFGTPPLGAAEWKESLELGESGLTNKLVTVEVVYDLKTAKEGELLRVSGSLRSVRLVHGEGAKETPVDQWLDVAFARGGPEARGEVSALFDPAKGAWREARSSLVLEHSGKFSGGSGRAKLERRVTVKFE